MLDRTNDNQLLDEATPSFVDEFAILSCQIHLPREYLEYLNESGPMSVSFDCRRDYPRFHCHLRGILYYTQGLSKVPRPSSSHIVVTKNLARGGLSFLHFEELFPCERFQIWIEGKQQFNIEVVRCRRESDRCFEIGARFCKS